MTKAVIIGCGNVGRRIARLCMQSGQSVAAISQSEASKQQNVNLGADVYNIDLDQSSMERSALSDNIEGAELYYLVPPQKKGITDHRTQNFLTWLSSNNYLPKKVVLISTTGVYGNCDGAWVTEKTPVNPQTDRGKRRANSEQQWSAWSEQHNVSLVILRVPGIYAYDRLPRERLEKQIPVVDVSECGYTNRIHAEDLARVCITAMNKAKNGTVYNVTDGVPGKITEYLQVAARVLELPQPPVISMQQAQQQLSSGMLSYLSESRRISNQLMLDELKIKLLYPDFKQGLLV